jgi:hypothetical protein
MAWEIQKRSKMPFFTQPGRTIGSGGDVPQVVNANAGSITCNKGRVVTLTAGATVLHALGAVVTNVYGVTLEGAAAGVTDGPGTLLPVAIADRNTEFVSKCVISGAVTADLSTVVVGSQYGMITVSGQDYIDVDDTTNVIAQVTKIDDDLNVVWFLFLESAIQQPNG